MLVRDCKPGDIVQLTHNGYSVGNELIYKITGFFEIGDAYVKAYKNHRQGKVNLCAYCECVLIDPKTDIVLKF